MRFFKFLKKVVNRKKKLFSQRNDKFLSSVFFYAFFTFNFLLLKKNEFHFFNFFLEKSFYLRFTIFLRKSLYPQIEKKSKILCIEKFLRTIKKKIVP